MAKKSSGRQGNGFWRRIDLKRVLAVSIFFGLLSLPLSSIAIKANNIVEKGIWLPIGECISDESLILRTLIGEVFQISVVLMPLVFGSLLGYKYTKGIRRKVGEVEVLASSLVFMLVWSVPFIVAGESLNTMGLTAFLLLYLGAVAGWMLGGWAGLHLRDKVR